jgi:hypothetical protein
MTTNQRQIALAVLESLRDELIYARLNNGSRVLDIADLRQYIYEQMNRIRTDGLAMRLYSDESVSKVTGPASSLDSAGTTPSE